MTDCLYPTVSGSGAAGDDPTADTLVERARALRPRLRELQEQHEELGGYSEEIHQAFLDAGLYKVLQPRRFGGHGLGLDAFMRVGIEISRGDPGVGWAYVLGTGHAFHAGSFYGEQAQKELFGGDVFIAPSRTVPAGRAEKVTAGYRLSGTWDYCSGSRWSTWAMVVAPTFDPAGTMVGLHMFALPRDQFTILDDWGGGQTLGMQASSSNSIRVKDAFIPEHLSIPYDFREHRLGSDGPIGFQVNQDPLFVGRTMLFFNAELVAAVVGTAWAALDEYEELMVAKKASFPPRTPRLGTPEYHRWFGSILARTDAAESLLLASTRQYTALARHWMDTGEEFTPEQDARLRAIAQEAAQLAGSAIETAFTTAGSSSARRGSRLQKYYRDLAMYKTHIAAQWDVTYASESRFHFGQPLVF